MSGDDLQNFQPIETVYAGHRFRSRLEARWAVFFDHLGVSWEYEPQGYIVGTPGAVENYLPDFWLPDIGIWAEVKGKATERDVRVLSKAGRPASQGGLEHNSDASELLNIIVLSNIPTIDHRGVPLHYGLHWDAGQGEVMASFVAWSAVPRQPVRTVSFRTGWLCWQAAPDRLTRPMSISFGAYFGQAIFDAYDAARTARFEHGERG